MNAVSVRIPEEELKEIEALSKVEKKAKSAILREVLTAGIRERRVEHAISLFQKKQATIGMAAKIAGISLSEFLELLVAHKIPFHYSKKELLEDIEGLL